MSSNPDSWEEEEEKTGFLVACRWREFPGLVIAVVFTVSPLVRGR